MKSISTRATSVFLGVFLLVGILAVGFSGWSVYWSLRSQTWPTVGGHITSSRMTQQETQHGGETYGVALTYDYQVGGTGYHGQRLSFGTMSASSGYAQQILARYPVGQMVTVHYAAGDPKNSVLEPGLHGGTAIPLVVGTVFILASIMFRRLAGQAATISPEVSRRGTLRTDRPPPLMGLIFMIVGGSVAGMSLIGPFNWMAIYAGSLFFLAGLGLLVWSWQMLRLTQIFGGLAGLLFLGLFHWICFGGQIPEGVGMLRWFIGGFLVLVDLALVSSLVRWWRGRSGRGPS